MQLKITNELIHKLTGAPISALEKKPLELYQQSTGSGNEIYVEGVLLDARDSWLDGIKGFFSPNAFRKAMDQTDGDITLYIDSPGGSVFGAANMLSQVIKARKDGKKVNAVITGQCSSAATYFLMDVDSAAISKTGFVMVHRASALAMGNYKDLEQVVEVLQKFDQQYIDQLADLTGKKAAEVESAVDKETWFTAQEALDYGLVQELYTSKGQGKSKVKQKSNFRMLINQLNEL